MSRLDGALSLAGIFLAGSLKNESLNFTEEERAALETAVSFLRDWPKYERLIGAAKDTHALLLALHDHNRPPDPTELHRIGSLRIALDALKDIEEGK